MRTDAEVTAAAERTADLALRCAELTRQRDRARGIAVALEGQVAALVEVHARYFDLDGKPGRDDTDPEPEDVWRYDRDFRAALDPDPTDRGTGRDGEGS